MAAPVSIPSSLLPLRVDGLIKRFDCYPEGSVVLTQLGVIGNLAAALQH